MSARNRLLYWAVTGSLLGFGWTGAWTSGLPFLLLGTNMLFYGMVKVGPTGFWTALIGFGMIPAFFLLYDYFTIERCLPGTVLTLPAGAPAGTRVSCGNVPDSYLYDGLFFAALALIGLAWSLFTVMRRQQ